MQKRLTDNEFIKYLENVHNISLNKGQRECVLTVEGPVLTIAVPGAGKTYSFCVRLFNMLWNYGIKPNKILAVTFSKASALDMNKKFENMFGEVMLKEYPNYRDTPMKFSTIHSFSYKILCDYSSMNNIQYKIIEDRKKFIISNIYKDICKDVITDDMYETIVSGIGFVKNRLMNLTEIQAISYEYHKNFYDIYIAYEDYKATKNFIDYDDMLSKSLDLLQNNSYIKEKYTNLFDYIMIDEGQDTSTVQFKIVEILSKKHLNICCVGDDDQSIYEWRGADVNNFLYFEKVYPNTKKIFMEQNYRSTKTIIDVSNLFIKTNKKRYDKNLFTEKDPGSKINIIECTNYKSEINYILKSLLQQTDLSKCAILYRNNSSAFAIANVLAKNNIQFSIRDYKASYFTHWMIKDLVNFIKFTLNIYDVEVFKSIALKMKRYISISMLNFITNINDDSLDVFEKLLKYPNLASYQKDTIKTLKQEFIRLKDKHTIYAINYICNDLGYMSYIEYMSETMGFSMESINDRLFVLKEITNDSKTIDTFETSLINFQKTLDYAKKNSSTNSVTLTTCNSSKGLEWDTVYMIDLNDGIFPSFKAISDFNDDNLDLMEADRKLYYVGITRARNNLYLLHTTNRNGSSAESSRFTKELYSIAKSLNACELKEYSLHKEDRTVSLFDLDEEISITSLKESSKSKKNTAKHKSSSKINSEKTLYYIGKKITHNVLGDGIIVKKDDKFIEVKFDSAVTKKLNIDICTKKGLIS